MSALVAVCTIIAICFIYKITLDAITASKLKRNKQNEELVKRQSEEIQSTSGTVPTVDSDTDPDRLRF